MEMKTHKIVDAAIGQAVCTAVSPHSVDSLDSSPQQSLTDASEKSRRADSGNAKWVLMDVGNVLIHFDHRETCERIRKLCKLGSRRGPDIYRFMFGPRDGSLSANDELELGNKTLTEIGEMLRDEFGTELKETDLASALNSTFKTTANPLAKNSMARLRRHGYRVGICSNTNAVHWAFLVDKAKWLLDADAHFLSFQMRARKPDEPFYKQIFRETERPADCHILFDDLLSNIEGARHAKMHGEVFESFEKLEAIVMNLPGW